MADDKQDPMSDFKFHCPHCQQPIAVPQELLGHAIECPTCAGRIQLPQPGAAAAEVADSRDGGLLVRVPAGAFEMGDGLDGDCPRHRIELGEYWIGVHCVTNRQYGRFVRETGHRAPDQADTGEPVWRHGRCPEDLLDHPVVCVSWEDAAAYAKWADLSLPTEAQWEKAARGPQGWIYPWGNEWDPRKCRNLSNKGDGTTAAAADYPLGAGGYGTLQQSGNVWEWCADWYDENYYAAGPVKDPAGARSGSIRVARGGCWNVGDAAGFRAAFRNGNVPDARSGDLGFRLAGKR